MSRSHKHNGWVVDRCCKKFQKRRAGKRVRREGDVQNGSHYKKLFESYNICDWKCEARTIGSDADAYKDWIK